MFRVRLSCREGRERSGTARGGGSLSNSSEADVISALLNGTAVSYYLP